MKTFRFQGILTFCALVLASSISYGAQILCNIDISNSQYKLAVKPSDDVYVFSKIDTAGDFRFMAQYLPGLQKFKTYVYHNSKSRFVLLSQQEFTLDPAQCQKDFGRNRIYGSAYEREFLFQCDQVCKD